uniref:RanBP2-type domain-containing protein n=1 Tax=Odontella aurita TaxID=265563 RepID=A0A7S4J1Q1_9STRA
MSGALFAVEGSGRSDHGGSIVERLPLVADFEAVLHRVARSSAHLETFRLGPGLLRNDSSNKWLGALKAISANCTMLRSLEVEGISFGPSGRQSSTSGAEAGSSSSVSALFEAMAVNCASLERLSLSRCSGVQDRHIQSLLLELRDGTASVPKLKELDLSYTDVNGLSFAALCSRRQMLTDNFGHGSANFIRKLNLDGTIVNVSWLKRIITTIGENLEELSVMECPRLVDAGPELWSVLASTKTEDYGQEGQQSALRHLSSLRMELGFDVSDYVAEAAVACSMAHATSGAESHSYEQEESETNQHFEGHQNESVESEMTWWSCRRCTLVNEPGSHRCAACNGRRSGSHVRPHRHKQPFVDSNRACQTEGEHSRFVPKVLDLEKLSHLPLTEFAVVLHLRDSFRERIQSGTSVNNFSTGRSTPLVQRILGALPRGVTDLSLLFPTTAELNRSSDGICSGADFFLLDERICSIMQKSVASSLRSLELGPIRLADATIFGAMISSLTSLKTLKLFGDRCLGLHTATILSEIFGTVAEGGHVEPCPNLEILQLTVARADGFVSSEELARYTPPHTNSNMHDRKNHDVTILSTSLKRLWLHGCEDLEVINLNAPFLERLTVAECSALVSLQFVGEDGSVIDTTVNENGSNGADISGGRLQHLRLSNCTSLSPYCVAAMRLPKLTRLDVDGLLLIEDWEFGALVAGAGQSLTSLRLNQCRSLGDVNEWKDPVSAFHPLSVLHIRQPSPALDCLALQTLFSGHCAQDAVLACSLRDLIVKNAPGVKGILCASPKSSNHTTQEQGFMDEELANHLSQSSAMFLPGGIDEEVADLQSSRGVERVLLSFVNRSRAGGSDELGFPPTLTSYQRKLVHEVAEDLGLVHESVRLGSGTKIVKVTIAVENIGVFDAVDQDLNANAEPNIWVAPEQIADEQHQDEGFGVTFALDGDDGDEDDNHDEEDDNGIFELEEEAVAPRQEEDSSCLVEEDTPTKAQSRRQQRKARKAAKKSGASLPDSGVVTDTVTKSGSDGEEDAEETAFDPLLQCERFARFDPKMYRRLTSLAHKLPADPDSGIAICLRYLRGVCPYQKTRDGGGACRYAHFEVKSSQQKKFAPLLDYVCGKTEEVAVGRRRSSKRRSQKHNYELATSLENDYGSYGTEDALQFMDSHMGNMRRGRKGNRGRRRKASMGNEDDHDSDGLSRSYGTDEGASDEGSSARGTSPARSADGFTLSSSPGDFTALNGNPTSSTLPSALNLQCLLSLELVKCPALTGACLHGPCLVRVSLHGCVKLNFLDLKAPQLTNLDVSECTCLHSLLLHSNSFRWLRVANLTGCKNLHEGFMSKLVNHCRGLRQLHIFGSGAAEKGRNIRERQRIKTKATFLAKLTAGRPELEVVTTKKEWRLLRAKREGAASNQFEEEEGAIGNLL